MAQRRGRGIVYQIIGAPQSPAQVDLLEIRWTVALIQQSNFIKRTHPQGDSRAGYIFDRARPIKLPCVQLVIAVVMWYRTSRLDPGAGVLERPAVGIIDFAADRADALVLLERRQDA